MLSITPFEKSTVHHIGIGQRLASDFMTTAVILAMTRDSIHTAVSPSGAQVRSSFVFRFSGVALGGLGAIPMFVYGLYLGTRHWPWFGTRETKLARGNEQLDFFGKERQVGCGLVRC